MQGPDSSYVVEDQTPLCDLDEAKNVTNLHFIVSKWFLYKGYRDYYYTDDCPNIMR